jgi:hypothetical protein
VPDLGEAGDAFSSLGFTVTPQADHPFGTSNRLVVVEGSYLELVAITHPELVPPDSGYVGRVRASAPGLAFIVLRSEDPDSDRHLGSILRFSRPAPQPDGSLLEATFTVILPEDLSSGIFYCHHHTPQAIWNAATLTHPNHTRRIEGVVRDGARATVTFEPAGRYLEVFGVTYGVPVYE